MPIPQGSMRGLQDLRTLSGTVDEIFMPHKTFLRIACLEMEKTRRGQERRSAMHRVQSIDRRLEDIEAEKRRLLALLEQHNAGNKGPKRPSAVVKRMACLRTGGYRLRY